MRRLGFRSRLFGLVILSGWGLGFSRCCVIVCIQGEWVPVLQWEKEVRRLGFRSRFFGLVILRLGFRV